MYTLLSMGTTLAILENHRENERCRCRRHIFHSRIMFVLPFQVCIA